jgi:hypothetical protein
MPTPGASEPHQPAAGQPAGPVSMAERGASVPVYVWVGLAVVVLTVVACGLALLAKPSPRVTGPPDSAAVVSGPGTGTGTGANRDVEEFPPLAAAGAAGGAPPSWSVGTWANTAKTRSAGAPGPLSNVRAAQAVLADLLRPTSTASHSPEEGRGKAAQGLELVRAAIAASNGDVQALQASTGVDIDSLVKALVTTRDAFS